MRLLFIHIAFPCQFLHLAFHCAALPGYELAAVASRALAPELIQVPGVRMAWYDPTPVSQVNVHPYAAGFDRDVRHGQGAVRAMLELRESGFVPDLILAHPFSGCAMFTRLVYPEAPLLVLAEWYYSGKVEIPYDSEPSLQQTPDSICGDVASNAVFSTVYAQADALVSATAWQREMLPPLFREKTLQLHEGINTRVACPAPAAAQPPSAVIQSPPAGASRADASRADASPAGASSADAAPPLAAALGEPELFFTPPRPGPENTPLLWAAALAEKAGSGPTGQMAGHTFGQTPYKTAGKGKATRRDRARSASSAPPSPPLLPPPPRFSSSDQVVSFVSRTLEPQRGFHYFMRALPLMQAACPEAHFVVVGRLHNGYRAGPSSGSFCDLYLEEVAAKIDFSRLHFTGQISYAQLYDLFRITAAHLYLSPPFFLSWSMLEAMSCGAPLLGSDTAPVREVICHGENGLLADPRDPAALAAALRELLQDRALGRRLGLAGREHVVKNYDFVSVCLPRWLNLIYSLAQPDSPENV